MDGLSGVIKFDHKGFRSEFVVQIVQLGEDGLQEVGRWTPTEIYLKQRNERASTSRRNCNVKNSSFNVVFPLVSR